MRPSDDICYRAVKERDPRFDGVFFTGVLTPARRTRAVHP
jgi:methylphosphotriester-DNA--protein-cysteine methyltransferase